MYHRVSVSSSPFALSRWEGPDLGPQPDPDDYYTCLQTYAFAEGDPATLLQFTNCFISSPCCKWPASQTARPERSPLTRPASRHAWRRREGTAAEALGGCIGFHRRRAPGRDPR